jgi:AraC family transcriptional regulator
MTASSLRDFLLHELEDHRKLRRSALLSGCKSEFMNQNQNLTPEISVADIDYLEVFGFLPSRSSNELNCGRLFALIVQYPADVPPMALPAIEDEDQLVLHLSNPVNLSGKIGDDTLKALSMPGTISTSPCSVPTVWQVRDGSPKILIMSIKHELFNQLAIEALDIDSKSINIVGKLGIRDPFVHQIGMAICNEMETPGPAGRLFIDSLTQALAIHLFRDYVVFPKIFVDVKGKLSPQVLRAVLDYIDEYLEENLALEKIAAVANLSTFHFSRLFKQTMNIPVHQYVLQKRLDCAKDLLIRGGFTITEIAARTGFADASHFYRHFKRRFGISPRILTK